MDHTKCDTFTYEYKLRTRFSANTYFCYFGRRVNIVCNTSNEDQDTTWGHTIRHVCKWYAHQAYWRRSYSTRKRWKTICPFFLPMPTAQFIQISRWPERL